MLAHLPPLPIAIDYFLEDGDSVITRNDEKGAILALKQRGRVHHLRSGLSVRSLQKLIAAMDKEYPILEYLVIGMSAGDPSQASTALIFPETFQAPHLRHLRPCNFSLPIGSRLLTSTVGLVTLSLVMGQPSTYFQPNTLLRWILLMPQLEMLTVYFEFPIPLAIPNYDPDHNVKPIIALVTLPNLRFFQFHGVSTYLEALAHRITTPRIKKFQIELLNQPPFSVPRFLQLMNTAESLSFHEAYLRFYDNQVVTTVYPHRDNRHFDIHTLQIGVFCRQLDLQVSSMARIANSLSQIFSAVEHLKLARFNHSQASGEVDRTEWRRLLRPLAM